jgi:Ca-activated chloride channel family protein
MRFLSRFLLGAAMVLGLAVPALAAERAIIVLDGSGSMWAQIEGEARITIARETLSSVLADLPAELELGFMTYGHREKGNCLDIEMLVQPAANTGAAIAAAADGINPKGMTPISDAVRLAAEELRFTEEKATVILITDGLETCEVDPCQLATDLEGQGIDFTTHVLGFGLSDEEGQQVACLAENTGGQYLSAQNGDDLVSALSSTVAQVAQAEPEPVAEPEPAPEPEPAVPDHTVAPTASLTEGGPDLTEDMAELVWSFHTVGADGAAGEWLRTEYNSGAKIDMEPGEYIMRAEWGEALLDQKITVTAGEVIEPHFVLNAGAINVRAFAAEGEPVDSGAAINVAYPGGEAYGYGEGLFRVPAGGITLTVTVGEGEVVQTFDLAAGETLDKDIVVGVGVAIVDASYVEGMLVEDSGLAVNLYKAKKAIDGSREEVAYGYGPGGEFQLPPGDYVAVAQMDEAEAEVPFTIAGGDRVEVNVVLDAGVVALDMPDIAGFNIYAAAKDIQGNRREVGYGYDAQYQTTLKAGDYVVVTRYGDDSETETEFTVTAGERVEVLAEQSAGKVKTK